MPTYRERSDVLERAVDSILTQTLTDLELIVILDDPGNSTNAALLERRAAGDPRLRLHVNPRNLGAWASYNVGLRLVRGLTSLSRISTMPLPPIASRHSVHIWEAHPDVDVVGASLAYVDAATGRRLMTRHYPAVVERSVRRFCPMAHGTTVRRSGLHERYGYYESRRRSGMPLTTSSGVGGMHKARRYGTPMTLCTRTISTRATSRAFMCVRSSETP